MYKYLGQFHNKIIEIMCLYPKIIDNPKYKPNKKNGYKKASEIPCADARMKAVAIGCGKCIECRRKKVREWMIRIQWEEKKAKIRGRTVTLTFSEEALGKLPKEANETCARAMYLFLKRWNKEKKRTIRHWFVTELGHEGTERVHLHGFVWEKDWQDIERIWGYGRVKFGDRNGNTAVTESSIRYTTKYVLKPDEKHKDFVGKILTSKGIGSEFAKSETARRYTKAGEDAKQYIKTESGTKIDIPIYYRNKIFTEETREKIWCKLLDKEKRYVMGEEIDVSTMEGIMLYKKTLEYYQKKNVKLGYNKQPWNKAEYYESRKTIEKNIKKND